MPRKTFVYPHPINAYIIKQLPISFIYSLSLSASQTMDQVYSDLLKLQDDYLLHLERHRRTKKIIDEE
ncbi:MAG: hypothetical protein E7J91_14830 [Enterococcus faecalis]|nr:hypothetical protein [Enterococcus faecalis]